MRCRPGAITGPFLMSILPSPPKTSIVKNRLDRHTPIVAPHVLLFISGGLALIYELLWMRRFTAVFGATTPAISATLVATFLGLAVGSAVLGKRAAGFREPLKVFGVLEICAGVSALLVEPIVRLYEHVYPALYGALAGSSAMFVATKTLLAVIALFVPSFCMGGTVPVVSTLFDAQRRRLGVSAGGLYAANTLGAVVGALSVPFFWLPRLGAGASYLACVTGSILVGAAAYCSRRRKEADSGRIASNPPLCVGGYEPYMLAALSGVLMFVLQVTQGRMFAQVHENSIYSFSVVLAVFLAALGAGATLARACLRRGIGVRHLLAIAWITGGIAVFASPHLFFALTDGLSYIRGSGGWTSTGASLLLITLPTVLVPVLLSGMVLPLLMELAGAGSDKPAGSLLGRLLAANTAGAIAGALLGAFLCPPWLGLWGTLAAVGMVMIVAGGFCLRSRWAPVSAGSVALIFWLVWNPSALPRTKVRHEKVLAIRESSHGILGVIEAGRDRRIALDNFYVLGGTASTGDERMQAHVPLLLHPAPKRVAFLGLGTGITAGAALLHPVERITALELVPEVVSAARKYFQAANLGVMDDSRVECIAEDGRNFLRGTKRQFDVIVGDLFVPWRRGESAMFSLEQFLSVRRALAPAGLFCQWLPLFQMSEAEFNIAAATFLEAFPRTTLWRGDLAPNLPAVALIGHTSEAALDPAVIERRVRELRPDSANPHLAHPAGLWMFLVGALDLNEPRFATAKRHRDGTPWLELLGPIAHAGSARGAQSLFVGRRLELFLAEVARQPIARLQPEQLAWRDAGARLREAILLAHEGQPAEAKLRAAAGGLPVEIQAAILGAPTPSPAKRESP